MATVDYFFSTRSPWTYLAGTRLEALAARQGAVINYRPLDMMGLFARTGGTPLADRHPNRLAYRAQDLPRQAAKLGMKLNMAPAFGGANTAPGSYAIITAARTGGGDIGGLVFGLLKARWAADRDTADDAVIRDCLSAAGFDPGLADKGLMTSADDYARNLEEAVLRGVYGSPFYIVAESDQRFWGQDRLEDLEAHLASLK